MSPETRPLAPAALRLVDFIAELGPRWGLPAEPCRVHAYLYLIDRAAAEGEICAALGIEAAACGAALAWLADMRLAGPVGTGWRTDGDPWELLLRALEERRRREIAPALNLLRTCRREALADRTTEPAVAGQIGRLLDLVEDLAAIDVQTRRLSPRTLRQLVRFGGRAARFLYRSPGRGERP
jgi:DNA-binding transcriptional regulator GbsR (MarR family)